jgi:hypothetical protein
MVKLKRQKADVPTQGGQLVQLRTRAGEEVPAAKVRLVHELAQDLTSTMAMVRK